VQVSGTQLQEILSELYTSLRTHVGANASPEQQALVKVVRDGIAQATMQLQETA
jgi:hypothetical protein